MRLLVIQEQHFVKMPNGEVWVDQQSSREFWQRYLNVFNDIVICARMKVNDITREYISSYLVRSVSSIMPGGVRKSAFNRLVRI